MKIISFSFMVSAGRAWLGFLAPGFSHGNCQMGTGAGTVEGCGETGTCPGNPYSSCPARASPRGLSVELVGLSHIAASRPTEFIQQLMSPVQG